MIFTYLFTTFFYIDTILFLNLKNIDIGTTNLLFTIFFFNEKKGGERNIFEIFLPSEKSFCF